ncbi:MAG TPA: ADP-forming succinate--CoA ligase subunit beta [Candidatus Paceibacterota bacterium]|nr:ADP-forming succinate--CoA ligase subunit beta [Verrucomicrobiota bacterium]HOX02387.1 ADP-forming succinate--CoA ligase subunit beta [Verrucomicrobiota bacterium]HRZ45141.1 ADP-forming succinate--CoA ligase subunit beta [Candidatus Paceibacterota bacterium]HRZ92971.1 ADP-forming succinate--CoA ligase subunit beta [Candidatus Paceibacterota bacterium]
MNIHEYQAKQLLARYGVPSPPGEVAAAPEEAGAIADRLIAAGEKRLVVKAQIHAGGRGRGRFKNGSQGGVRLCSTASEAAAHARAMLGEVLVTRQTGPEGRRVNRVLVESASDITREFYLAVILDRAIARPVVVLSTEGGMDVEEIAEKHPEKIVREPVDPAAGFMPYQARKLAARLGFTGDMLVSASSLIVGVFRTWWETDATLVEINPLCVVQQADGHASLVVDAKMSFDDNALFRHPEIREMRDLGEESPLEIEASEHNLSYIKLAGNIGCLVNGAGLAMATMDIVQSVGGEPANFLDVGGSANKEQVKAALKIILKDPGVQGIWINIFGGIMQCDIIAQGVVDAAREIGPLEVPLVVRLAGNNSDLGNQILRESGLPILSADGMEEAARKVVEAVTCCR